MLFLGHFHLSKSQRNSSVKKCSFHSCPNLSQHPSALCSQHHFQGRIGHPGGNITRVPSHKQVTANIWTPMLWTKLLRRKSCEGCWPIFFYEQFRLVLLGLSNWQGLWDNRASDPGWLAVDGTTWKLATPDCSFRADHFKAGVRKVCASIKKVLLHLLITPDDI